MGGGGGGVTWLHGCMAAWLHGLLLLLSFFCGTVELWNRGGVRSEVEEEEEER